VRAAGPPTTVLLSMMTNFGFQLGILDYWMFLTDWRNGSFAILLALGILLVGNALTLRHKTLAAEALSPAKGISRQLPSTSEVGPLRTFEITMARDHGSSPRLRETTKTEINMDDSVCELHDDGEDVFVLVDGVKIARRGRPDTAQAMTWIVLEPGWTVRDVQSGNAISGNAIEVRYEGARVHQWCPFLA
jgi:hypothetical protein